MWTPDLGTIVIAEHKAEVARAAKRKAVNVDRGRRVRFGKVINGIQVTGRDKYARNLTNLALGAQVRIAGGDTMRPTTYRDGNNVDYELTPLHLLDLWRQSADYVSALYAASWAVKAMDPMPPAVFELFRYYQPPLSCTGAGSNSKFTWRALTVRSLPSASDRWAGSAEAG